MNEYEQALLSVPCWDQACQDEYLSKRFVVQDRLLQNRAELSVLCQWMQEQQVTSYLEIGIWTGRLLSFFAQHFNFTCLAACDLLHAARLGLPIHLPPQAVFFQGSSHELQYRAWRHELGPIDVVLIDGDHSYEGVKQDFRINRLYPHRFLVFHDIANPLVPGPGQFWRELQGNKIEIILPNPELNDPSQTMGLGIWSASLP